MNGNTFECDLLICIQSCVNYRNRRDVCRNSWLKHLPDNVSYFFGVGDMRMKIPGIDPDEPDVVRLPCADDYMHLYLKTREMFRYAVQRYKFHHLMKCDDDTYVVADRAFPAVKDHAFVGDVWSYTASGGAGYFIREAEVRRLLDLLCEDNMPFSPEDVMVTTKLKSIGVERYGLPLLFRSCALNLPTRESGQITAHYVGKEVAADIEVLLYGDGVISASVVDELRGKVRDPLPRLYLWRRDGKARYVVNGIASRRGECSLLPTGQLQLMPHDKKDPVVLDYIGDGFWEQENLGPMAVVTPLELKDVLALVDEKE